MNTNINNIISIVLLFFYSFLNAQKIQDSIKLIEDKDDYKLKIGGAIRVHYRDDFHNEIRKKEGGEFAFDLFGLNVATSYKGIKAYGDLRIMAPSYGGTMLKEIWVGHNFKNGDDIQVGLVQVPFGHLDYATNSWYLGIGYGVGYEGSYGMGIKYHHKGSKLDWQLAFIKNPMETFSNDPELRHRTWSASVLGEHKEINGLTGQINYKIKSENTSHKIGASAQAGQLYNFIEDKMGDRYAFATHYDFSYKKFGLKLQAYNYKINPKGTEDTKTVDVGSFNYTYPIVSSANVYQISARYTIPLKNTGLLNQIMFYSEYGHIDKKFNLNKSVMTNNGIMFLLGQKLYIYTEYVSGYNHPFLGGQEHGLYNGTDNKWHSRIQCNFGYYW